MTQDLGELASPAFVRLSHPRQAFLLDLTSDYLRYRIDTTDESAFELKERNRTALTAAVDSGFHPRILW